ncbi:MAG: S9 family peptidase [Gemmatimonadetes bacterium]|nr:S9 family peptidase [Gemmatimonadota bacterium]MDA1103916.1 S9 family peptidase [Gemmatimonadota bacterium]
MSIDRRVLLAACTAALLTASPLLGQAVAPESTKKRMTMEESLMLPAWGGYQISPDNTKLLFTKREMDREEWESVTHVWVHDLVTEESIQLTNSVKGESDARWLPDGRVLFTSRRGEDSDAENRLWVISLRGGEAVPFFEDEEAPATGSFTEDYSRVAYTEESDRVDKEEWEERRKTKDDGYYAEAKLTWTHVWVYDVESGEKTQVTQGEFDHQGPQWSPDGQWIAFTSNRTQSQMGDPDRSDNTDVLVVSADGGEPRNLSANNSGADRGPVWSPDGTRIAYTGSLQENSGAAQSDVFVVDVAGGSPRNLTADMDFSASGVEWSADGRTVLFTVANGLTSHLYRVPASGGRAETVLPDDEYIYGGTSISEDGTKLVFTGSSPRTTGEVFVSDVDGSNIRHVLSPTNQMEDFDLGRAELLTWQGADGWDIDGVLTYPVGYVEGQRYPMILQVHGGPHGRFSKGFNSGSQIWAARGYAVLQGNPRGSSGRTLEFSNANYMDWGGKDFEDLMAGVDLIVERGIADPEMLAIMGGSYGGFMTFWGVTQTDRFKAAIGHAAISDWYSFYGQTDIPFLLEFGFGGLPWETKETFERFSPIEFAENVTTPLLITHGEEDRRVPIAQGEQYFRTLKKMGNDVEFLRFPREGHGIQEPRHRIFLDQEQAKWFERWVRSPRAVTDGER